MGFWEQIFSEFKDENHSAMREHDLFVFIIWKGVFFKLVIFDNFVKFIIRSLGKLDDFSIRLVKHFLSLLSPCFNLGLEDSFNNFSISEYLSFFNSGDHTLITLS